MYIKNKEKPTPNKSIDTKWLYASHLTSMPTVQNQIRLVQKNYQLNDTNSFIQLQKMKYPINEIRKYVQPFYENKDIMHDFTHIERIKYALIELTKKTKLNFDSELAEIALYFHGIIYSHEQLIRNFLTEKKLPSEEIELIIKIAWESQKENKPTTNEGLILHDAHMLEGGRNFEIVKSLITGSVRGQSLKETMNYIEKNLLEKGQCYTKEGIKQYELMKTRTKEIYEELNMGIGRIEK